MEKILPTQHVDVSQIHHFATDNNKFVVLDRNDGCIYNIIHDYDDVVVVLGDSDFAREEGVLVISHYNSFGMAEMKLELGERFLVIQMGEAVRLQKTIKLFKRELRLV